jgi:hypothetical protein
VAGCCEISRGVCSSPRSSFSAWGKSSTVCRGFANEIPPVKDNVVYYSFDLFEKQSKEKENQFGRKRYSSGFYLLHRSCLPEIHSFTLQEIVAANVLFPDRLQFTETRKPQSATNPCLRCFLFSKENKMIRGSRPLSLMLLGAALASGVGVACASHPYRVYDPYYTDYHVWNNDEVVYYNRWAGETHRDPHRDFRKLNKDDQKQYWTWRHNHEEHH